MIHKSTTHIKIEMFYSLSRSVNVDSCRRIFMLFFMEAEFTFQNDNNAFQRVFLKLRNSETRSNFVLVHP